MNPTLKSTMVLARELQSRYDAMNAAPTQSVRNPYPMHTLVLKLLPALPKPDDLLTRTIYPTIKVNGKQIRKKCSARVWASEVLGGRSFWDTHAVTATSMTAFLKSKGFLAYEPTVRQTLSNLKAKGMIVGQLATENSAHCGYRPPTVYYVHDKAA